MGDLAARVTSLGSIDPGRKGLVARLGLRAIISGTLAAFVTACFAGILV